MWRILTAAALLSLSLLGLSYGGHLQRQPAVKWSLVRQGTKSQATQVGTFVLDNPNDLRNYWIKTFGSADGLPTDINFATDLAVAVNLGPRAKNGYSVWIRAVEKISATEMRVTWSERYPPDWSTPQTMQLSPFALIRIGRQATPRITLSQAPSVPAPLSLLAAAGVSINPGGGYYDCPWTGYITGDLCQYTDPYSAVIVDFGSLSSYWPVAFGASALIPSDINFATEQLVVLHLGRRPSTGYGLVVQGLKWIDQSTVQVEWYENTPPAGSVQAMHVTSPYTLVKIPKGQVKVTFKKITPPTPTKQ